MGGQDVRNAVEQPGQVPGEIGVPGVGVDDVGALHPGDHLQIHTEGAQGRIGAVELSDLRVTGHARVRTLGARLARSSESVHAHIGQWA